MRKGNRDRQPTDTTIARVVIYVEGGNVQSVLSDTPGIEVMIVDYDNEEAGDDPASRSFEFVEVNEAYIERTIQGIEE